MLERNLSLPHEVVCATDDPRGIDKRIRIAPLETQLIGLGNAFPKLAAFRPDAAEIFGKRICVIDLDSVIVSSLDTLLDCDDDFVVWKDAAKFRPHEPNRFKYNTSLFLLTAGSRSVVWNSFSPQTSPRIIKTSGRCGSDQGWVSHCLDGERTWDAGDGVLSWQYEVWRQPPKPNARIVFYHGPRKPWNLPNDPIVKQYWN